MLLAISLESDIVRRSVENGIRGKGRQMGKFMTNRILLFVRTLAGAVLLMSCQPMALGQSPAEPATLPPSPTANPYPMPPAPTEAAGVSILPVQPLSPPPAGYSDRAGEGIPSAGPLSLAAGPFSVWLSPDVGHFPFRATYGVAWFPNESVQGQNTNLGAVVQDASFAFPLWQVPGDEWSGFVSVRNESFDTSAILPDTRQPFPEELWNVRFGTTFRHLFENGWIGGGTVSIGSASDKPFHSIDEMTAGVNAFLVVPQGEHNAWLFSLHYSSNSDIPFPIPLIAYIWQPSEQFRANIGLPFQIVYCPTENLTLDFTYMLLTTIHTRATYRVSPLLRVYGGFDWSNESYLLAHRFGENEQFFYYDMRLTAGLQRVLCKNLLLDLSGGFAFDRFYFEGRSLDDENHNRVDVGAGPFLALQLHARW
jgi:hypothetical protein